MIEIGLLIENYSPPGKEPDFEAISRTAQQAEKLGFDSLWVTDHLVLGSKRVFPFLESLTTIGALSARTRKIRFGVCILVLPLREPVLLAKVLATLDHISKGRIVLAVGAGWYKREFDACGVPYSARGRLTEEKLGILRKLLSNEDMTGEYGGAKFDHVTLKPKPENLRILMGGYVEKALRRAGRLADGWIPTAYTPEDFDEAWASVKTYAKEAHRDITKLEGGNLVISCVDASSADERVRKFASSYFDQVPWGKVDYPNSAVAGDPEACVSRIREYERVGVKHLVLAPCDYEERQIELLANEVLPSLK